MHPPLKSPLTVAENRLTPETFCRLRDRVRFQPYSPEDVRTALEGSLYTVSVLEGTETVGIARVVGDGRVAFFIKDVVVDPDRQGAGIGRILMDAVLRYIRRAACPRAYVGLMATPGTEGFYERFGFISRPAPGLGHGMVWFTPAEPHRPAPGRG